MKDEAKTHNSIRRILSNGNADGAQGGAATLNGRGGWCDARPNLGKKKARHPTALANPGYRCSLPGLAGFTGSTLHGT